MSTVYFHTPTGEALLRGSERHHLAALVNDIAIALWRLDGLEAKDFAAIINPTHYMATLPFKDRARWQTSMRTALLVSDEDRPMLAWKGTPISTWTIDLNTALAVGNDQVKLATRIHGQCEIHAYVEGPNRTWLADIMQAGVESGVYRKGFWFNDGRGGAQTWSDQGWGDVIALLRARDDEPVVMSYSVCRGFPNRDAAGWVPALAADWRPTWCATTEATAEWEAMDEASRAEAREDAADEVWGDLPVEQQWALAMAGIRSGQLGTEIKPDGWETFFFGHGLTVFDLQASDRDQRLDIAVGA